jgi:multicomponent Na+:H+ antiporter subunit G
MTVILVEGVAALLLLAGGLLSLVSALGVYRLPDVLIRMHASSKAGTLGAGMILLAVAVLYGSGEIVARVVAAILFLLLTVPVASHMIGRAAYMSGVKLWSGTVIDELRERYEARKREEAETSPNDPEK